MQRTGNVGGSGGGYWSEGTANYNLPQVTVPIQQMPLGRINPNPGVSIYRILACHIVFIAKN